MERRKYSNEFKTEAVRLSEKSDVSKVKLARELGIRPELLYRWISEFGSNPGVSVKESLNEHDENIRLRKELRRVSEERDILKKAMGIFTKELP
jgi:transposase